MFAHLFTGSKNVLKYITKISIRIISPIIAELQGSDSDPSNRKGCKTDWTPNFLCVVFLGFYGYWYLFIWQAFILNLSHIYAYKYHKIYKLMHKIFMQFFFFIPIPLFLTKNTCMAIVKKRILDFSSCSRLLWSIEHFIFPLFFIVIDIDFYYNTVSYIFHF